MQHPTAPSSSAPLPVGGTSDPGQLPPAGSSFAELLAALAMPPMPDTSWNDEGLQDDVATISDERTLSTHAQPVRPVSNDRAPISRAEIDEHGATRGKTDCIATPKPLKTASITIRLSQSECTQLRRRAAEAGLTVSAYLRSCTLEVEDLRAQVKQTLADLRDSAAHPPPPPTPVSVATTRPRGIRPLLTRPTQWLRRFM